MLKMPNKSNFCTAIIVAAGSALRMGGIDKIMAPLSDKPLIYHTVLAFQQNPLIQEIIVVSREDLLEKIAEICQKSNFSKVKSVVLGGADRVESVLIGTEYASKKAKYLAIHDGARPLVSQKVITETIRKCYKFSASAPAVPVKDTIKVAKNGIVESTPARENLAAIQTPQVFDADLLRAALANAKQKNLAVTDDCSCVEAMGMRVFLTEGEERNVKITTPIDLKIAELWYKKGE